jgi:hypothetical protein
MGYDVHITRAAHWSDSAATPITLDEWIEHVRSDPELRLDGHAEALSSSGETVRYESAGLVVWTAHSAHAAGGMAWFDFREGRVVVKNPDEETLMKMRQVARCLGARVQGDDGEHHDSPQDAGPTQNRGSWWRRLRGRS